MNFCCRSCASVLLRLWRCRSIVAAALLVVGDHHPFGACPLYPLAHSPVVDAKPGCQVLPADGLLCPEVEHLCEQVRRLAVDDLHRRDERRLNTGVDGVLRALQRGAERSHQLFARVDVPALQERDG